MSTRGAIARPNGDGFLGRYHHFDAYPSGLGATLYGLAQPNSILVAAGLPPTPWDGDVEAMLKVLLDDHTGWSTINGCDMRLTPGFQEYGSNAPCVECGQNSNAHLCQYNKDGHAAKMPCSDGTYAMHLGHLYQQEPEAALRESVTPRCYCHGDRSEEGWSVDEHNASGSGVEYVYVIDAESRKMTVLSSYAEFDGKVEKMIGFFGMGAADAEWKPIGYVDLDKPAPNWERMYEGQYEEAIA